MCFSHGDNASRKSTNVCTSKLARTHIGIMHSLAPNPIRHLFIGFLVESKMRSLSYFLTHAGPRQRLLWLKWKCRIGGGPHHWEKNFWLAVQLGKSVHKNRSRRERGKVPWAFRCYFTHYLQFILIFHLHLFISANCSFFIRHISNEKRLY